MFDISWTEILVIMVVGLIAIGPKELPRVLFELGKWVRHLRLMAGEFQRHFSDMMHEAELDEVRKQVQAAREMTKPASLAELVDPGGGIRRSLDPTVSGAEGYVGSPPEAVAPEVHEAEPVGHPGVTTAPVAPTIKVEG